MSASEFTPGQRRIIILMIAAVIVVFAMLAGFVVTSFPGLDELTPTPTPSPTTVVHSSPTPLPAPTPSPTPAPTVEEGIWSQVKAARLFDQIAHQVEVLRGLSPRAEVPLSFHDEREMSTLLRRRYIQSEPETQLLPYTELGLLPDVPISIRVRQVAGVYVPEQEQLYVTTSQQESSVDDQALLAHAYAHALQDQHFDLGAMDARATTTDARLAIQALVEGDATLLTALYRYQDLAAADWEHVSELILQAEQPSYGEELDLIEAWTRLQRFPYWEGHRFTHTLFQAGGWEAINSAFITPPRSTEQVLHPERYLEERHEPASVVVPDLGTVLGADWTMILHDTLGEFVTGLYLNALLSEEVAWQAADGWDGDTFVVWEHQDGSRTVVWRTIWGSNAEAAEFERALGALIAQHHLPVRPVDPQRGLTGRWWETSAGAIYVSHVARYVTLVQAPDVSILTNVVGALP